jgi:hypothetical protein
MVGYPTKISCFDDAMSGGGGGGATNKKKPTKGQILVYQETAPQQ